MPLCKGVNLIVKVSMSNLDEIILDMYDEGYDDEYIACYLGVSVHYVSSVIDDYYDYLDDYYGNLDS